VQPAKGDAVPQEWNLHVQIAVGLEGHPARMLGFRLVVLDYPQRVELKIVDLVRALPPQIEPEGASGPVWMKAHHDGLIRFDLCLPLVCFCRGILLVHLI
jgi:hypothetical protein